MKGMVLFNNFGLLLVFLVVSLSLSASALTTFGKTSPQNPNPLPPPTPAFDLVTSRTALEFGRLTSSGRSGGRPGTKTGYHGLGKAKECRVESDCVPIQNTTCTADPRDPKTTRCLCGDYSAPINGLCTNKFKAVGLPCHNDEECGEKALCIAGNNTALEKKCQCKEGYFEENFQCNGCYSIHFPLGLVMGLLISLSMS